jgi:nitrate reductase molybdenum cofactor assembly chaperone NarJ/NarW
MMKSFASYSEMNPLEHLQEVYTRTFDLQPSCSPYIGYQLFGEGHRRGYCLARLKERYRECSFSFANELPDHVAVMLRFLALVSDEEESKELVEFCFTPALGKMIESLASDRNPYAQVLQALALTIRALHQTDIAAQTEA